MSEELRKLAENAAQKIAERVAELLDPQQLATLGKGGRVPSTTLRYNVRQAKRGVAKIALDELLAALAKQEAAPPRLSEEQVELALQNQAAYDSNDELDSRKLANLLNTALASVPQPTPTPDASGEPETDNPNRPMTIDDPMCECGLLASHKGPHNAGQPQQIPSQISGIDPSARRLFFCLEEIRQVASGEVQIAVDDTAGMAWIDKRAQEELVKPLACAQRDRELIERGVRAGIEAAAQEAWRWASSGVIAKSIRALDIAVIVKKLEIGG